MSAFNTVICIKPKRYAGWNFSGAAARKAASVYFYHQCKILLSLWFLIVSCHLCICNKKELAPISSPKSWRFDLKSRPPKWLKWLKWQSKSKGQETSRFKWASKYLIVFFGWFLFSCQTDSKPKCCGGCSTKTNIAGTFRSMFRGTGEFGFMCESLA